MTAFLLALLACAASADPFLDTSANACYQACSWVPDTCGERAWSDAGGEWAACIDACDAAQDVDAWPSCYTDQGLTEGGEWGTSFCADTIAQCGTRPCDPNAQAGDRYPDACPE